MITSYSRGLMVSIPQGTLIDIETTGLDRIHDETVVFGYVQGSRLEIICRTSKDEEPFIAQIAGLIPKLPRPDAISGCSGPIVFSQTARACP